MSTPRRLSRHQLHALRDWLTRAVGDGVLSPAVTCLSTGTRRNTRHVLHATHPEAAAVGRLDCARCAAEGGLLAAPSFPGWELAPANNLPAPLTGEQVFALLCPACAEKVPS